MTKIIVYSRDDCPYCNMAKKLLHDQQADYVEYSIGHNITREEVLQLVEQEGISNMLPIVKLTDGTYTNYTGLLDYFYPPLKDN